MLHKIFNKISKSRNLYIFLNTKMTISHRKVRYVLPRRDVCRRLIAKYLHIHNPNQNLKKVWIFCVSLLYVPCSCEVFPPVWRPAGRGSRRFRVPPRVRRKALTRHYTRLTAAAVDPTDTNIVLGEYQATSENLPELKGENQPRIKQTSAIKEIIPYPVLARQIQTFS